MIEMFVRIVDPEKSGNFYEDVTRTEKGNVIVCVSSADAERVWNEMLANGRVTQKQYDDAQREDGTFKWPWGTKELDAPEHRIFIVPDMDAVEGKSYLTTENSDPLLDKTRRKRIYKLDLDNLPIKYDLDQSVIEIEAQDIRDVKVDTPKQDDPNIL